MNNPHNILFTVHQCGENGVITAYQYEEDFLTQEVHSKIAIPSDDNFDFATNFDWDTRDTKLNLSCHCLEPDEEIVTVIKTENFDELNHTAYLNILNDTAEFKNNNCQHLPLKIRAEGKIPNIPTMVRCQNCDTNFPTKYQYQRHQCEFNADKVVLKPDADIKDIDKGMRIKYDCSTCGKQFVSKNNLDRHQTSHNSTQENVCEHCNKQFVSENRLRIHKENHCKKAGDISKFYRSDVTVWKCLRCNQVFATQASAIRHCESCSEVAHVDLEAKEPTEEEALPDANGETNTTNKNVEKILTELLLQCEFCNRTYSDRAILVAHQKKHATDANYECVTCKESFASYTIATKHWITKCSDEANLFYLPKMTYCEHCDRTFKSHEILYTHKIKKKHYTPKVHNNDALTNGRLNENETDAATASNNKDVLVKLIEDVLTNMEVSVQCSAGDEKEDDPNKVVKEEEGGTQEAQKGTEKKKRGRKRKNFKQIWKGKRPLSSAEDGFKYQCERCILVFDHVNDLDNHRAKEHASNFSCEECGQVVHSAKALVIHSRAHQSLKPYVCEQCGRSYSQTSHLWQHMRFHQGIKPFACPHEGCEARYTIRPDLKDHIRKVHTRERPFKCSTCNKCFLTGSVYYQHRLIHTNDRRYGCDICGKRFFRADALNNHRRIHTDERPYPCEICGREFRQKGDRNKHVRTQHPN